MEDFISNFTGNLFKPLLLFFYAGFLIPILRVKFEFPKVLYKGLTVYLLLAIGWHGGEQLAGLDASQYGQAAAFIALGFFTNLSIGVLAYNILRYFTKIKRVDAATVAGYYGSDSAGTFVTCVGVLTAAQIAFAPYMPVLLAVMEIPGCLVALFLVSRMRTRGMDGNGFMPGEAGFDASCPRVEHKIAENHDEEEDELEETVKTVQKIREEVKVGSGSTTSKSLVGVGIGRGNNTSRGDDSYHGDDAVPFDDEYKATLDREEEYCGMDNEESWKANESLDQTDSNETKPQSEAARVAQPTAQATAAAALTEQHAGGNLTAHLLHEVFLNPGIYMLFAGLVIGFAGKLQGEKVIAANDIFFNHLFHGILCLFLLEMGMMAAKKLKDLRQGGLRFIAFGLAAPNLFATIGILVAHTFSLVTGTQLDLGTYVLFGVLCGSASYIALPAVQNLAIPEASPTLPLAASLGLTFTYNVTIGIPVYMSIAKALMYYC